mmetsp:Transcript_5515/g.7735  ORF Transcript_5515/g.7735 Transcript_5515/m.7735 type:complete len:269 (+) Transcript_5515:157-963(+)
MTHDSSSTNPHPFGSEFTAHCTSPPPFHSFPMQVLVVPSHCCVHSPNGIHPTSEPSSTFALPVFAETPREKEDDQGSVDERTSLLGGDETPTPTERPLQRNPFRQLGHLFANPRVAISIAMAEIVIMAYILLYKLNMVEGSFFQLGPPVVMFQFKIEGQTEYWAILFVFFAHQLVYTWLYETLTPWMMNEVQDPTNTSLRFSKFQTVLIINLYYIYYTINAFITVNASLSQMGFLIAILLADCIATTLLNTHYVWNKIPINKSGSCNV